MLKYTTKTGLHVSLGLSRRGDGGGWVVMYVGSGDGADEFETVPLTREDAEVLARDLKRLASKLPRAEEVA